MKNAILTSSLSNRNKYTAIAALSSTFKEEKTTWEYVAMILIGEQKKMQSNKRSEIIAISEKHVNSSPTRRKRKTVKGYKYKDVQCYKYGGVGHIGKHCRTQRGNM